MILKVRIKQLSQCLPYELVVGYDDIILASIYYEWCNASFMETQDPCVSVCYAQYGAMLFCINSMNVIGYKSIYHREITKLLYLWKMFLHFVSVMLKGVWSILFVVNWILLNMNVHARFLYTIVPLGFEFIILWTIVGLSYIEY